MAGSLNFKKNPSTRFQSIEELSEKQAEKEIKALRKGMEHHNHLYYVKNNPEISDAVYDKLFQRLQELEDEFPKFQSDTSPTRRVGAEPVDELKKVKHYEPMLSLNATLEDAEVRRFTERIGKKTGEKYAFVTEPKFDGVSVEVVYKEGTFQSGSTRGDGRTGEDITENLKTIGSLPMHLQKKSDSPPLLVLRAEVYMPKEGFQKLNKKRIEEGKEAYANPRNTAAGLLRRLDPKEVARTPLAIVFYEILKIDGEEFSTHWEELQRMRRWGLKISSHNKRCKSHEDVTKYHTELAEKREDLSYEIDGVVIKVNELGLRKELGTRDRSPRWALAWKFAPKEEVTKIEDIAVQVGRTGMLTPVALLQPVDVGGVTVSRATLHNEDEVHRKDVRVGDKVRIIRAGDVIPEVQERIHQKGVKRGKKFIMPAKCPVCGTKTEREGAYVFCPAGLACRAQLVGRIQHYASREAMDIDHLGEKTVRELVDKELVKTLADLYELTVEDLLNLERFAKKSAKKLHDAIQGAKKQRLDRFLYALGIRHIGRQMARQLAREFQNLDAVRKADEKELKQIPDVGKEVAAAVHRFFSEPENQKVLDRLQKAGVKVQSMPQQKKKSRLQGKTFVFTGELDAFTRDEAKEEVELLGARASSSVSGSTDYVVVGEDPGSKREEAKKRGVKMLDEKEFKQLLST